MDNLFGINRTDQAFQEWREQGIRLFLIPIPFLFPPSLFLFHFPSPSYHQSLMILILVWVHGPTIPIKKDLFVITIVITQWKPPSTSPSQPTHFIASLQRPKLPVGYAKYGCADCFGRKLGDHTYLSRNNDQSSTATATGIQRPGQDGCMNVVLNVLVFSNESSKSGKSGVFWRLELVAGHGVKRL